MGVPVEDVPVFRWLVFGCGGVGGYFGARLAQQGQNVNFMARNQALAALKKQGVRVKSICGDVTVPPERLGALIDTSRLSESDEEPPEKRLRTEEIFEADVIMLACKAWEAEGCLKLCRPWCGPNTLILPLQNGVEGFDKIRSVVGSWGRGHALAGCCNIISAIQEPGLIRHWAVDPPKLTFGEFEGEPLPKTKQLKAVFDKCQGMAGFLEVGAMSKIWEKFAWICSTVAVQANSGPSATHDVMAKIPELFQMWRSAMKEIIALARSFGMTYEDVWLENREKMLAQAVGATTSCSRDIWAGKPSELDDLLGSVVRMGRAQGMPTPVITTLYTSLLVREKLARAQADLTIYPLTEGQKLLGTVCNRRQQQPPACLSLEQQQEDCAAPEWFVCPMSSCVQTGGQVEVPEGVQMAWEVELGVVISKTCRRVPAERAAEYIGGYVVVLDMTGKSLGFESVKHEGTPSARSKCQASFKPVGRFIRASEIPDPHALTLVCKVNGEVVARDTTSDVRLNVSELVADASAFTPLRRGDVILLGAGSTGDLALGDSVEGCIEGLEPQFTVGARLARFSQ